MAWPPAWEEVWHWEEEVEFGEGRYCPFCHSHNYVTQGYCMVCGQLPRNRPSVSETLRLQKRPDWPHDQETRTKQKAQTWDQTEDAWDRSGQAWGRQTWSTEDAWDYTEDAWDHKRRLEASKREATSTEEEWGQQAWGHKRRLEASMCGANKRAKKHGMCETHPLWRPSPKWPPTPPPPPKPTVLARIGHIDTSEEDEDQPAEEYEEPPAPEEFEAPAEESEEEAETHNRVTPQHDEPQDPQKATVEQIAFELQKLSNALLVQGRTTQDTG